MREFAFRDDAIRTAAPSAPLQTRRHTLFYNEGFRLKFWPILFTLLLAMLIPLLAQIAVLAVQHFGYLQDRPLLPWVSLYYSHAAQLIFTLLFVLLLKPFIRADFGFHRPVGKSYVREAVFWGALFGLFITAADFASNIVAQRAPVGPYDVTSVNIAGWVGFQGFVSGLTEEPFYRGLLVTFLAATMPGKLGVGPFRINGAGLVIALLFALVRLTSFVTEPWWMAVSQIVYVFALGVLYAYWLEKSKSLVAPIVGHNVSGATEYILIFAMVAAWS